MIKGFKIFISGIVISCLLSTGTIRAQILQDSASLNLLKKGIDYLYNFRFDSATEVYNKLSRHYPSHPVIYLFRGMVTYWENYPLIPSSAAHVSYEADMRSCIELSEKKHDPDKLEEYLLTDLCARGMLLLYYTDNDLSAEVFPLTISTYQCVRRSFDYTGSYYDFYFFTGLYNYYREAYPEAYPIYKALAMLFPRGDKAKGLRELKTAAEKSIILKAESYAFLSDIFSSYEANFQQASLYCKSLYDLYPANLEYLTDYLKYLLFEEKYDKAEELINSSCKNINNSFFQAELAIFNGILMEKKYHNYTEAQKYYVRGAREISIFGKPGNEYAAYAYFGLSRISDDKQEKKFNRKQALKLANFRKIDFD